MNTKWTRYISIIGVCLLFFWGACADSAIQISSCPESIEEMKIYLIEGNQSYQGICPSSLEGLKRLYAFSMPCKGGDSFALPKLANNQHLLFVFGRPDGKSSYCETCKEGVEMNTKRVCTLFGPYTCQEKEDCASDQDDDCDGVINNGCKPVSESSSEKVDERTPENTEPDVDGPDASAPDEPLQTESFVEPPAEPISDVRDAGVEPPEKSELTPEERSFDQKNDPTADKKNPEKWSFEITRLEKINLPDRLGGMEQLIPERKDYSCTNTAECAAKGLGKCVGGTCRCSTSLDCKSRLCFQGRCF